jgi:hypothetical protein
VAILRRLLRAAPIAAAPTLDVNLLLHELEGFSPHDLNTLAVRAGG